VNAASTTDNRHPHALATVGVDPVRALSLAAAAAT
jgi:hypothetical protein